jgi:cytochrome bd-type quinol oxidase subunit 2
VKTVTQSQHTHPLTLRRWAAIGLGVTAITASVLLIATDAITGSSRWAHHPGISAAPLLLIAAAIAAGTLAQPPRQRRRLMPAVAALAFTAWGLAQLLPSSAAAGYLNDTAILLFVADAAYAVTANARNATPAPQQPSRAAPEPARTEPSQS